MFLEQDEYSNSITLIGPREPWHDIHSKVEGSIAYDVFENFHERWERQGTKEGPLTHIKDIYSIEKLHDYHPLQMDPQRQEQISYRTGNY